MANRDERNEFATAKWDADEVRRQASSEQRRSSDRRRQSKRNRTVIYLACVLLACAFADLWIGWMYWSRTVSSSSAWWTTSPAPRPFVWQILLTG